MTSVLTPPTLSAWRDRIEDARKRLVATIQAVDSDYFDWAPDEGIAPAREHLWAIAESARALVRGLTCERGSGVAYRADEVPVREILLLLESCHRQLMRVLEERDDEGIQPDDQLLISEHLQRAAHHGAAIMLLFQLVDPTRPSALLY